MRLPFNISFINKRRKAYLSAIFIFFAAFALLFSQVRFREDISEMLPSVLKEEMRLFQNSPLSNKIFIVVEGSNEEETRKSADIISYAFIEDGDLGLSFSKTDEDFILSYYYYAPYLWNEEFAQKAEKLITPQAVKARMEENYKNLISPAGVFVKDFIIADPLGMMPVFAEELKNLNLSNALEAKNGYISSHDGKNILLIFDYPKNSLDSAQAKKINEVFNNIKRDLPEGSGAFLMGAVRYTNENSGIIVKDIKKILFISSFLMLALFLVFLRTRKALLIYLVPPAVMAVAAVTVYFCLNGISGITIGFGSVLMGLSIDYAMYMCFAMKASKEHERFINAGKTVKPIVGSAVTSIAAFSLLFLSSIPLFKQIALFSVVGLAAALFLAVFAAPFVFECEGAAEKKLGKIKVFMSASAAAAVIILIFAFAAVSFKFVKFNASLDSLNTVSKQFEEDRHKFEKLTGSAYNNNAFFFVFGGTAEKALENNEIISSKNNVLKLAKLYPSQKASEDNLAAWKKFWDAQKIELIKKEIADFSKRKGLKAEIFDPFFEFLKTGRTPYEQEFSLNNIYNPLIKHNEGFAFVNIVPENAVIAEVEGINTFFVSNAALQEKMASSIKSSVVLMMIILTISTFFVLILWLKNVQFALIALLPPLCGVCAFLIAAAVLGIEVNLFGLFAAPLLIGLGIDYGIFIIYQQKGEAELHPTKAVLAAALSTMIGFGALMAASHKVLFIIGFMVFTGILASILISIFILPALIKNSKKALFVLLLCILPFAGCASGIRYNVKGPPPPADNANTAVFYGAYKKNLNFRAISRTEPDGYRIVIMNDLGVKLQDMKIRKNEDTDVYFYIDYMPKEVIEDFAGFFKEYYFSEEKTNIKYDVLAIYYYKNKEAVIWIKKI